MSSENYLKDISEIKTLMNKSSRFISLSGLSGILAGFYALIGATFAYWFYTLDGNEYIVIESEIFNFLILDILIVGILSVGTAIFLTTKKAKKNDEKIWDSLTRRLLTSFIVPLLAGGIYILIILNQQKYGQTGALMLLFYGLALLNASKYTLGDVKYLGYTQIILGLLCAVFPSYGFWFWVIGFGFMHIIYGASMYYKYDRK
ncbi:hypothetical protein BW723_01760 [Polaribacter reichenbachii]|uniref:Uncharacterized protein n=1 Tax=Polaribacter reichenbachii TaxID=996801 RepID=A0A1B8TW62_9FLAO|nr:hypothetical protein [Polaribacter reichenbachii]APZ45098.1 hypothetical protein BW723_01760 [Polaribacter reichenbachii]AUC18960.1 hypothetical protein BTO17_09760 [Polaribacter reichenbachii]OBY63883.1 hypothetical protein LPB301_13940 [Polaribacter reichenbachii]